jgi:hypothetical protein
MEVQRSKGSRMLTDGHDAHRGTALMLKEEDEWRRIFGRISEIRAAQSDRGMSDCAGKASAHYCDQGACVYHAECLSISVLISQSFP